MLAQQRRILHQRQRTLAKKDNCTVSLSCQCCDIMNLQELLQEQDVEVVDQCMSDVCRPTMFQNILPECEIR